MLKWGGNGSRTANASPIGEPSWEGEAGDMPYPHPNGKKKIGKAGE